MAKYPYHTVDEYLQQCDEAYCKRLEDIIEVVQDLVSGAEEKISWGLPIFLYHGYLLQIAQCKGYIGFYPGHDAIQAFTEELKPYVCTKTAIHFPMNEELPMGLIQRIVVFCKEYNETH